MTDNALDLADHFIDRGYCVTVIPIRYDDGTPECSVVALEPHEAVLPALTHDDVSQRVRALTLVAIASHNKLGEHNLTFRTHLA
ncbi:hypothetical protein UFOVP952_7 [uncultured Caudovirales phage]|uniref:Uncharacterized protein n=1 Tax=uncultured Caudovirales phage TaxID=2100421 RepID=A0A6J5S790_9CAUD|nr:hypothetical protein UFOVP952_7 [uncultured Caudovirales phage]CAB4204336.1 hypothetical protein UFOVP1392_52 [uncultured Caudovirales phage]CAB5230250.1 hypothetical protein UFOVP1569_51 [uncultured Caudovirales phage]